MSRSPAHALQFFGFRQTIRGGLIIGILAGLIMGAQGPAYNAAYPNEASRHAFVASLEAAPALGFMAGETANASAPASYSVYKSITLMTIVTAVWGLTVTTRLLRGQEEDGRLELILANNVTKRRAALHLLAGFLYSFLIASALAFIGIASLGRLPNVGLSASHAALLTAGIFLPGLFFGALGLLTSQLAATRQRALAYGLVPLLILFVVRGGANSNANLNWMKRLTPFGWTDLLNPVLDPHVIWLVPTLLFAVAAGGWAIYLAGRRDLGGSILRESQTTRSHFYLLGSPLQLAIRQHIWAFIWWGVGALALSTFVAALAKMSAGILEDASGVKAAIAKLGSTQNELAVAFIGIGSLFTVLILLAMATIGMGRIRRDEARSYVDNLFVQPVRRSTWLTGRLSIIIGMFTILSPACASITWYIATHIEGFDTLHLLDMLGIAVSLTGTVIFTLGAGTLAYGLAPRLAVPFMTLIIGWAFIVDILKSLLHLDDTVEKTSLLHYVSTSPTATPDWTAFGWLVGLGVVMAGLGVIAFTKRDIITE